MKLYNKDNIAAPKVPFRGFRGEILIIILIIIAMPSLPLCVHAQFSATDRQPFSESNRSVSHSTVDSNKSDGFFNSGMKKGPGGPGIQPPNGDDGDGDWVGSDPIEFEGSIHDACGFLLLLAIGYGVIRRKKQPLNPLKGT